MNVARAASTVLGWSYFAVWSASFWPQFLLNWRRKSVVGMSFDFQCINFLGYVSYSAYTICLRFDGPTRRAYHEAFGRAADLVALPDVCFALHGCALTVAQIVQCFVYERGDQGLSRPCVGAVAALAGASAAYGAVVAFRGRDTGPASWLDFLYWLSVLKLGITTIKYVPQVLLNRRRRSTTGWSIANVLMDLLGGTLSVAQVVLDGSTVGWDGVLRDPVKFGLGLLSFVYDGIFIVQHYVLYREAPAAPDVRFHGAADALLERPRRPGPDGVIHV